MPWVALDDQIFMNRKVARCDPGAKLLYIVGLVYCGNQLTDGYIPQETLPLLAGMAGTDLANAKQNASKLCSIGLWDAVDDAWHIPDYLDYNPSREEVEHKKAVRAEAGRLGGLAKAGKNVASAKQFAKQDGSKSLPPSPTPSPTPKEETEAATPRAATAAPSSTPPSKRLRKEKPETPEQVTWFRSVTGRFPPKELFPKVIEIVDGRRDADMLIACWSEWIGRGYNRVNYGWFLDWYKKGKIPPGRNGSGPDSEAAKSEAYRRKMAIIMGTTGATDGN